MADSSDLDLSTLTAGSKYTFDGDDGTHEFRTAFQRPAGPVGSLLSDNNGYIGMAQFIGTVQLNKGDFCQTLEAGKAVYDNGFGDSWLIFLITETVLGTPSDKQFMMLHFNGDSTVSDEA